MLVTIQRKAWGDRDRGKNPKVILKLLTKITSTLRRGRQWLKTKEKGESKGAIPNQQRWTFT